jgi:hypothetical protein
VTQDENLREQKTSMNRIKELSDWLKTDTDKMFDQMANVEKITKESE